MKKVRIANKRRFITSLVTFLLVIQLLLNFVLGFDTAEGEEVTQVSYINYEVKSCDTLWDIALEHKPQYVSTFKYIDDIKSINNMKSDFIKSGEELIIPISSENILN